MYLLKQNHPTVSLFSLMTPLPAKIITTTRPTLMMAACVKVEHGQALLTDNSCVFIFFQTLIVPTQAHVLHCQNILQFRN
jgi:hypothetical protein